MLKSITIRIKAVSREEGLTSLFKRGFKYLVHRFIRTNREADELASKFRDFRQHHLNARERMDKGAIAHFIYIGLEPAYICWIAMNEPAKATLDDVPCQIDFTNREAFAGGELTISKFRRKGLKTYGVHLRDLLLKEMGVTKKLSAISVRNDGNLKATIGRKNRIYAKAIYIKILWWKFYKEIPFSPPLPVEQVVSQYK